LLIPVFIWGKYIPADTKFDIIILTSSMLLGVSNGVATNWLLIRTPAQKRLSATMKEPSGFLMVFCLVLGLLGGALLAAVIDNIDFSRFF
jgi:hypothetical protein